MPVLNLDTIAPQTIDIQKGEREWKLRADVPASVLVRCFYLVEMEQQRPKLDVDVAGGQIDFAAVRAYEQLAAMHEASEEALALEILGRIWRWSYPEMSEDELAAAFAPTERRQIVEAFFLILLARSGKLPAAATSASSSTASPSQSEITPAPATTSENPARVTASFRTSRGQASTHSGTRSPAASSRSHGKRGKAKVEAKIEAIETTTASGARASIY